MTANTVTVTRPKLHPLVISAIAKFEESGLSPRPDHVIWMQEAALRIRKQNSERMATMVDWPVQCGGVNLFPLSFAAIEWLRRLDEDLQNMPLVQAFACAHSHERATLMKTLDRGNVVKAVQEWSGSIAASPQALSAALNVVVGRDDSDEVEIACQTPRKEDKAQSRAEAVEYGAFVLALTSKFPGTSPDYWTWEVSMDYALHTLNSLINADPEAVRGKEMTAHIHFRAIVVEIEKELLNARDAQASKPMESKHDEHE